MTSPRQQKQLHIILNPASGHPGLSQTLFASHLQPLLAALQASGSWDVVRHETKEEGDGVRVGGEVRAAIGVQKEVHAILLGGDGTTHEFLHGLILGNPDADEDRENEESASLDEVQLAIVPTGTANALYAGLYPPGSVSEEGKEGSDDEHAWRLRSARALLAALLQDTARQPKGEEKEEEERRTLVPLTLTRTRTVRPATTLHQEHLAHIITSHALHAGILRDSEALRAQYPGIERFKMAAQMNAAIWADGVVRLLPLSGERAGVSVYDPAREVFVEPSREGGGGEVRLEGPFLYLAALTTDRLEPHFVPAPFSSTAALSQASSHPNPHPRPPAAIDILAIRPLRSPAVSDALAQLAPAQGDAGGEKTSIWASERAAGVRAQFALGALTSITAQMYDGGKHVALTYPVSAATRAGANAKVQEEALERAGRGEAVVEYYRAAGYVWEPAEGDAQAQLTCIDGTVVRSIKTEVTVLHEWAGRVGVWR
ncbi:hypothetical protein OC834_006833 [Tilletia horrida]|nr:hypothetical protein OC834_006833 [Tilletia horrida]